MIDYELNGIQNGLDIIDMYNISKNATLVTNRYDDLEIQSRCLASGIKIIPKNLIFNIPIVNVN